VKTTIVASVLLLASLASAPSAWAGGDATAFLGTTVKSATTTTSARGAALGFGLAIVAFEFEYSATSADESSYTPSLKTGSFNGLLQMPVPIGRLQFYATAGAGLFQERLSNDSTTNVAVNTGGGVKITLAGPVRLRIDYRVFKLSGNPINAHVQRLYAGINLKF
jgi:hypothetical protein